MGERVRLATGRGPLGTGVFLLGRRRGSGEDWPARPWVCVLCVPVFPLRTALFRGPWAEAAGQAWEVVRELDAGLPARDFVRTIAGAAGALLLGLGPAWFAWTKIHQTGLVESLYVVVGAAAPILVAMWRDLSAPRVLR